MASIARLVNRQGRCLGAISRLCQPKAAALPVITNKALISTSDKKKDISASVEPMESSELKRLSKHFEDTNQDNEENYTSYGYSPGDRDEDWFLHHTLMFFTITCGFIGGGFILAYFPDLKWLVGIPGRLYFFVLLIQMVSLLIKRLRDWCHREAFLELERREREGLPLVDPNYVDPTTITLPSDEELGETEIII